MKKKNQLRWIWNNWKNFRTLIRTLMHFMGFSTQPFKLYPKDLIARIPLLLSLLRVVRERRLELLQVLPHRLLRPARLPIPPLTQNEV
jgi:hypothetical protein